MAKYKAKSTYKDSKDNFASCGSVQKHLALMRGESVEIEKLSKKIEKHLEKVVEKSKSENKPKSGAK